VVLSNDFFWPFAVGVAVFGMGYGLAIARSGGLPRWLGWIAFVLGVLAITPLAFIAFLGLMAWSLVASTLIYLRSAPAAVAAAG
jgi:hypothetical protein